MRRPRRYRLRRSNVEGGDSPNVICKHVAGAARSAKCSRGRSLDSEMRIPLSSLAVYAASVIDDDEDKLLDQFAGLSTDEVRALAAKRWATCRSGSLALAFAERLAPRSA